MEKAHMASQTSFWDPVSIIFGIEGNNYSDEAEKGESSRGWKGLQHLKAKDVLLQGAS